MALQSYQMKTIHYFIISEISDHFTSCADLDKITVHRQHVSKALLMPLITTPAHLQGADNRQSLHFVFLQETAKSKAELLVKTIDDKDQG